MSVPFRFVEEIPFGPWWENPSSVADLIEWLAYRRDWDHEATLYLLRHPEEFSADWEEMQAYGETRVP